MDSMPPMPKLELSIEQQLRLEQMRRDIPNASREDLEKMLYQFIRMNLILQNNLSQVFKWASGQKTL
jgi:translation initiation factor 2 beta subunit (eIF-2beta)/eIF-5